MAVTVTPNLTDLVDCDTLTGNPVAGSFDASQGSPAVVTDIYREASGSIGVELRSKGVQYLKFIRGAGTWDLSNTHIYIWFMNLFFNALEDKALGGIRILVGDGANVGYWYVGGKDTYSGGWTCLVIDTARAFDSGSCTLSAVTEVGIGVNYASNVRNLETTYMDIARYGDGITVTSDAPCTLQDIYEYSASDADGRAHGIIRKEGGVYFVQGKIRFGDAAAGSITFEDTSQVIVFEDKDVNADLYEIVVQGNAGGTTSVKFGTKSGSRGISGCVIRAEGAAKYDFTATDPDIDSLGLYGCVLYDADSVQLPANAANREVLDTSFEECGEVIANTCVVQYCSFISADNRAVRISSTSHNVTDCKFINCPRAVHTDVAATYLFDALVFSGGTYHIENSTPGGDVYINRTNGSNPDEAKLENSGAPPGTITINPLSVYLTVWVKDGANQPIENASVAIYKSSDDTELMNELTLANGQAQETFQYTADTDIYIRIRKSSTGATRYSPIVTSGIIESTGYTLTAVMAEDLIAVS